MNNKIKLNTLAFITIIFWSAAYPLTKVAAQDFDCYTITALRAFIAAAVMLIIGLVTHIRKIFKFSHYNFEPDNRNRSNLYGNRGMENFRRKTEACWMDINGNGFCRRMYTVAVGR